MSSITTIISNSDGKVSLTQMDSTGFKFKELCSKDADISSLKIPEEILNEFEIPKASIENLDISKCEDFHEAIAAIGNKLNEVIEFLNTKQIDFKINQKEIEKAIKLFEERRNLKCQK